MTKMDSAFPAASGSQQRTIAYQGFGAILLSVLTIGPAAAAPVTITIPQSALIPSTYYYTDLIGGGIGNPAIMTSGGNRANVGQSRSDDGYAGPIDLGYTFKFFEKNYTQFWANNNGNISFSNGIGYWEPKGPPGVSEPIISPFFGDVDTTGTNSGLMHIRNDIPNQTIITWDRVGYYSGKDDKLNSFQMVIRGSNYKVPDGEGTIGFFFKGLGWEAAEGTSVTGAVGFGDGEGNAIVLEGSSKPGLIGNLENHSLWFNQNLTPVPPNEVPIPAAVWLFGSGAAALFGAARRRRRATASIA